MMRSSATSLHQRQVLGAPARRAAFEAEDVLDSRPCAASSPRVPDACAAVADREQDLVLLLVERVCRLLEPWSSATLRAFTMWPALEFFGLAHVDDERALVDEADGVRGRDVRQRAAAQPQLIEHRGQQR